MTCVLYYKPAKMLLHVVFESKWYFRDCGDYVTTKNQLTETTSFSRKKKKHLLDLKIKKSGTVVTDHLCI